MPSLRGSLQAGQILLSPQKLSLGIQGAINAPLAADPKVEIPSSPVVVVDNDVWWHKTHSGYWLGFVKMPRTVRLLLEWTGWGLPTIHTSVEDVGGTTKAVTWSVRLRCVACKEKVGIEWKKERPIAVCYSCKREWPASAAQVEDFLALIGKKCTRCGRAYRVKQSISGSWGAVCSGGCQGWNSLRQLLL